MPKMVHNLRKWDFIAAQRPDYYIANSQNTAERIKKYYKRESELIYPCIDTTKFNNITKKEDFYFYIGRCIPYKKFDLLVDAFNKNGKKLILATNTDNKLYRKLKKKSNSNIEWRLNLSQQEKNKLYAQAKAFLFPPEEDFGLVPLEAMSTGTPVIAYGKGWALETVIKWKTGLFFNEQTVDSLNSTILIFEHKKFDPVEIRKHAKQFDKEVFKKKILQFIEDKTEA